ncbi:hemicentin-1 isoform X2 [Hyalella azteca]|uniref:Hemicentin-1 isoform X2 n=1 Tax=Hyalella azteca TaxID=294128 RepID=A0A8B7P1J8_HYAAZ|nr:hemicentin-1 isoform X2 [Hyalella azteca]
MPCFEQSSFGNGSEKPEANAQCSFLSSLTERSIEKVNLSSKQGETVERHCRSGEPYLSDPNEPDKSAISNKVGTASSDRSQSTDCTGLLAETIGPEDEHCSRFQFQSTGSTNKHCSEGHPNENMPTDKRCSKLRSKSFAHLDKLSTGQNSQQMQKIHPHLVPIMLKSEEIKDGNHLGLQSEISVVMNMESNKLPVLSAGLYHRVRSDESFVQIMAEEDQFCPMFQSEISRLGNETRRGKPLKAGRVALKTSAKNDNASNLTLESPIKYIDIDTPSFHYRSNVSIGPQSSNSADHNSQPPAPPRRSRENEHASIPESSHCESKDFLTGKNPSNIRKIGDFSSYFTRMLLLSFIFFGAVLCLEPEFLEPLENVTVTEGREATFTCVVDHLGGFKVAWIKADTKAILAIHNRVITHNNRMSVIHSDHNTWELTIKSVRRNDSGEYMCQINTDPMKNQVGYLNVVIPPDIVSEETSGDIMVPEGSPVKLTCSAHGYPEPTIKWRREDGAPIILRSQGGPKNELTVYEGRDLVLEKVTRDDMGAYMCIASNDIPPAVSKRILVMVHFHPLVRIPNQLVGAPRGTDVTLECEVEASPKSINYWTKLDQHGPVIVDSRKYVNEEIIKNPYTMALRLSVKNLDEGDFTTYSCTAKNSLGEVVGSIKLYEIEPPSPRTTATEPPPVTESRDLLSGGRNHADIATRVDVVAPGDQRSYHHQINRYAYSTRPPPYLNQPTTIGSHYSQNNYRDILGMSSGAGSSMGVYDRAWRVLVMVVCGIISVVVLGENTRNGEWNVMLQ